MRIQKTTTISLESYKWLENNNIKLSEFIDDKIKEEKEKTI